MKTIYKYPLYALPSLQFMPKDAKILSVMVQNSTICLWAEVDTNYPLVERRFNTYDTGAELPTNPGAYIGSVMIGVYVWHVYEETV